MATVPVSPRGPLPPPVGAPRGPPIAGAPRGFPPRGVPPPAGRGVPVAGPRGAPVVAPRGAPVVAPRGQPARVSPARTPVPAVAPARAPSPVRTGSPRGGAYPPPADPWSWMHSVGTGHGPYAGNGSPVRGNRMLGNHDYSYSSYGAPAYHPAYGGGGSNPEQKVGQGPTRYIGEGHFGPIFAQDPAPAVEAGGYEPTMTSPPRLRYPWQSMDDYEARGPVSSPPPGRGMGGGMMGGGMGMASPHRSMSPVPYGGQPYGAGYGAGGYY